MRSNYSLVLLLMICCFTSCEESPQSIPDSRLYDYALYDSQGDFHRLSRYNNSKGIVLMVQGNGCPIVRNTLNDFKGIYYEYEDQGFKFFFVNSNIQDSRQF